MSNVLPVPEQKRLWAHHRQRFISLGAVTFSILAIITIITLLPSYLLLFLNHPQSSALKAKGTNKDERAEAAKTQALIATLLPVIVSTSSTMTVIQEALEGRPSSVFLDRISYTADVKQKTIVIGGTAQSRDDINNFRKELEAKDIYKSVSVPVGDLIGSSDNHFTITLITKN